MFPASSIVPVVAHALVARLRFADDDALLTAAERQRRATDAARAAVLGSTYRGKLVVRFRTADGGVYRLQTCVWAVDDEYLVLQAGVALPLRAVLRLEFS